MKTKRQSAAILTIKSPGKMTAAGRKSIAAWLRRHAQTLLKYGDQYTEGRFVGRYDYR